MVTCIAAPTQSTDQTISPTDEVLLGVLDRSNVNLAELSQPTVFMAAMTAIRGARTCWGVALERRLHELRDNAQALRDLLERTQLAAAA